MKLSFDFLNPQFIEGREEFEEDPLFSSLSKKVLDWQCDDFSQIVNTCTNNLKDISFQIKTNNLKVHSEDFKSFIDKIWTAIKNFFSKLGSLLMFWKKKVNTFFSDKTKEIQKYIPIADKLNSTTPFDVDKLNASHTTFFLLKEEATSIEKFEFTFSNINRMDMLFNNIKKYVNDPELNHKDEMVNLERSKDDESFQQMLGVELITNTKEELVPSRIIVKGVMSIYESVTIGDEIKFTDCFNINDHGVFTQLKGSLHTLLKITKNSQDLSHMLESIEKSYKEMDEGIKWKFHLKNSPDSQITLAKTSAVVKAKDHISKSKILIEEFTKLLNMMCVTVINACKILEDSKK